MRLSWLCANKAYDLSSRYYALVERQALVEARQFDVDDVQLLRTAAHENLLRELALVSAKLGDPSAARQLGLQFVTGRDQPAVVQEIGR